MGLTCSQYAAAAVRFWSMAVLPWLKKKTGSSAVRR